MAAAISLSLPPGAMFSYMFTKHEILNYRDRQEEFLVVQRNRIADQPRAAALGRVAPDPIFPTPNSF